MGNKTRFSIAKQDIIQYFQELGVKVFTKSDISQILGKNRKFWRLTESLTVDGFIELLLKATDLKQHSIEFPTRPYVRYSWGEVDAIEIALSLNVHGYMSHYTALSYHGLTEQIPKSIYINVEQAIKGKSTTKDLDQTQIDNAFAKPTKISNNYTVYNDNTIYLLNGKHTELLGVETDEKGWRVTNLERTLIDIIIRPEYSGGIFEVTKAFSNAAEKVSINKMVSYLKKMDFIYPYHQCIGFYLTATGKYRDSQIQLLRKIDISRKFYLVHGISEKAFSTEWNLYYPANFQF